ncbi:MAG TPA: PAS domain-containing protein [Bryobacteraceae bacterium]|nr:PAS domain-containing protein [Bryobacteraceae bacterium]
MAGNTSGPLRKAARGRLLAHFKAFALPLPEALLLLESDGSVLCANPAALKLLEAPEHQVQGKRVDELAVESPSQVAEYLAAWSRSSQFTVGALTWRGGSRGRMECRVEGALVQHAGGRAILLRAVPRDLAASRFVALNEKIGQLSREATIRILAEEDALRSRQHLEAVIDHSAAAVWLKDAEGRYLVINRHYQELVGESHGDVAGKTDFDLFPCDVAGALHEHDRLVLERDQSMEFEETLPHEHGNRTFLSLKFPVPDAVTGARGLGCISTDITARKRLNEQFRESQKLESLGVLAGGVAHDFNNLLTSIMGNASIALETTSPGAAAHPVIREVLQASERAAHLTRQMLAYAGKARFSVERLNLSETVRDLASLVRTSVPRNVELRLELAGGLPAVEADPGQMQQIVMNLVINGAEAVGEGQAGTVLVTTGSLYLEADAIRNEFPGEALSPGAYVFLQVHDTGAGMDEATRARIYDPFFTTKFAGRGLGLSAVQGIVREHRGSIRLSSSPGVGTTFRVLFPAVSAGQPTAAQAETRPDRSGSGTVLVVDDDDMVRRTARIMLEREGYTVITAGNGVEALEVFRRDGNRIRLVLLDLTMPVMGGEEALRQLRLLRPDVRVLLSSGYNELEVVRRFSQKGVAGFIQKPYTTARLAAKVKAALEAAS